MTTLNIFSENTPLSVVIITLNESKNIGNLLSDLAEQSYRNFEVIVVDSNSRDDTVALAESYRSELNLRTIVMQGKGTGLGRNTGAQAAKYERIVFFDADVRIPSDFLQKTVEQLAERRLLVAAGRMTTDGGWLNRLGIRLFDFGMLLTQFNFPTCTGACIFSTRTVHQTIGGFDLDLVLCEDCDYVKRAAQTFKFRMLPVFFDFNTRRLDQDGIFKMGAVYLRANIIRFFKGELRNNEIEYPFDHYDQT